MELALSTIKVPIRVNSSIHRHGTTSPLLALPAEIRLLIYSYILPTTHLPVKLCATIGKAGARSCKTFIIAWRKQMIQLTDIIRQNGLHLLPLCKQIRAEILPELQSIPAIFHCEKCLAIFLDKLSDNTTIGLKWLQHIQVEVYIDAMKDRERIPIRTPSGISLIRRYAFDAMERIKKITWTHYGQLDGIGKGKWAIADMRPKGSVYEDRSPEHNFRIVPMVHSTEKDGDFWLVSGYLNVSAMEESLVPRELANRSFQFVGGRRCQSLLLDDTLTVKCIREEHSKLPTPSPVAPLWPGNYRDSWLAAQNECQAWGSGFS